MTKRTFQPKGKKRSRTHGYRQRIKSRNGRKVLKRRSLKGRVRLTV